MAEHRINVRGHRWAAMLAVVACDTESTAADQGTVDACEDHVDATTCSHAEPGGLSCAWYDVETVTDANACVSQIEGACLQLARRDSTAGCGEDQPYYRVEPNGDVALVAQCTDNPPHGYLACGGAAADPDAAGACACWTDPSP